MNQDSAVIGCSCVIALLIIIGIIGYYGLIVYGIITLIHYLEAHT